MPTRYIREGDNLFFAWIIEGQYRRPHNRFTNGMVIKPQYVVIDEKYNGTILEVVDYFWIEMIQKGEAHMPIYKQQQLIPVTYLVEDGDPVPWDAARLANPRVAEIEQELDILRGRVPTPKGYTIDKAQTRKLLAELRQIKKDMGY